MGFRAAGWLWDYSGSDRLVPHSFADAATNFDSTRSGLLTSPQPPLNTVDLGCGPNKTPDAVGVDHFPYPGVDVVCNLDEAPWPLDDNSFDRIIASHVIEHVKSIPDFMREIHRIARPGAEVWIRTPHFSSHNSWQDPTHRWHLGTRWHETFCEENYLAAQLPSFEFVSVKVKFARSPRTLLTRIEAHYFGPGRWEGRRAFRVPAQEFTTCLRVAKT